MNRLKFGERKARLLPENWEDKRIGDCIELLYGKGLTKAKRELGDFPVYGSNGMVDYHSKTYVKGPGIIVGRKGSVGEVSFSKGDFWPIDTTYYVKVKNGNDINFWFYFLKTLRLNQRNTHSAVPGLNRNDVYEIEKKIPSYSEQKAIAKILSDLDSNIELNNEMNRTLEAIGQAIFKHWFVDFEFPNNEGEPYKSSGGEMLDAELREIPKGWRICKLDELVTISKESCNPSKTPEDTFIYYSISAYDNGEIPVEELGKNILSNKFIVKGNSILLCKLNPRFPRCWAIWDDNKKKSVSSTEFLVLIPRKVIYYSFIYRLLKSNYIQNYLQSHITGTSSSHQRVRPKDILELNITIPTEKILTKYHKVTSKTLIKIDSNKIQNKSLSHIRDSLLPRLMSGRIRVSIG